MYTLASNNNAWKFPVVWGTFEHWNFHSDEIKGEKNIIQMNYLGKCPRRSEHDFVMNKYRHFCTHFNYLLAIEIKIVWWIFCLVLTLWIHRACSFIIVITLTMRIRGSFGTKSRSAHRRPGRNFSHFPALALIAALRSARVLWRALSGPVSEKTNSRHCFGRSKILFFFSLRPSQN